MRSELLTLAVVAAPLTACSSDSPATEHVRLAALKFDVPAGWQRTDSERRGIASAEWRPDENAGKESLLVIRTETASIPPEGAGPALESAVAEIQKGLNRAKLGTSSHLKTASGFEGVSISVDFQPALGQGNYHRVHVVLIDQPGGALIHVLYTARTPDPRQVGLQMVLDSLRHEEG